MTVTPENVRDEMVALQPPGIALPKSPTSWWVRLLTGIAVEFSRVRNRVAELRRELNPATCDALLAEWERAYGLPDRCMAGVAQTVDERKARLRAKVASLGGQSRAYFIAVAVRMGLVITIEETTPFYIGEHGCGDPIGGLEWRWHWIAHAEGSYSAAVKSAFECAIKALKPSQTTVAFEYED